jgi:ABC-type lipoprotein release transport system permease subunit
MVVVIIMLVLVTGLVASVYPARKALKYKPAEAIRIDM